ncbi:MAG: cupin domain-containing protein [Nannocystaceae bacterium]|nr:cupin domain-containing protein [Nannocystaceae bacterium]
MDPQPRRRQFSPELAWTPTDTSGVHKKLLLGAGDESTHEVSILRLEGGARLTDFPAGWGIELIVLEGVWQLPEGPLEAQGYSRRPSAHANAGITPTGCTLYVRSGPFAAGDHELVHTPTNKQVWHPGHGNLRVSSLSSVESDGSAFVHWPAGERFVHHQHWGGEEVFVVSGTFRDEHGVYPQGTWTQTPHLSAHHPWVEQDTTIFVKTGHLPVDVRASEVRSVGVSGSL